MKKKPFLGFEILHYINEKETIECVESIRKCCVNYAYHVVIVDNNSPDDSFFKLKEIFFGATDVTLLKSPQNLGFAKGNNLGFMYLKYNFSCDFIIMSNNDIEILSKDFIKKIVYYYDKYKFAALGPNIQNYGYSSGKCNPMICHPQTLSEVIKIRVRLFIDYILTWLCLYDILHKLKEMTIGLKRDAVVDIDYSIVHEDVQLHGCFMVFSIEFIKRRDGLNNNTFMYSEESVLYYEMLSNNLKSITVPDIFVLHKENISVRSAYKNNRKRQLFILKHKLKSNKYCYEAAKKYWHSKLGVD